MLFDAFLIAARQLRRNGTRTLLTSLGIFIGVVAVIVMVGVGRGAAQAVNQDLAGLGDNLLFVMPGADQHGPSGFASAKAFTEADADAIASQIDGLEAVAPTAGVPVVASAGDALHRTTVTGSTLAYLTAMKWELHDGRVFSDADLLAGGDVCLLGQTVATELFGAASPIGAAVRLDRLSCTVVGLLTAKGQNTFGQDQDDFILVPLRTFQRRLSGTRDVSAIFLSARADADSDRVKADVEALLRQRRHTREGAEPDFHVRDMKEVAAMLGSISTVLTSLLAAIAAVSLLVGGIGIMNIMMVSVTERTREIGIRLAVGALARDVLLQFLVEAMVLASVGGLAGVLVGVAASWAVARGLGIPWVVDPIVVGGAFGFSGLIGMVFGYLPARRAARLRPIDALRHE